MSEHTGRVVTTEGAVTPSSIGFTLPHEHVFIDFNKAQSSASSDSKYSIIDETVSIDNLWHVRRNPMQYEDNRRLADAQTAREELDRFVQSGGETIVDVTPKHIGDPQRVRNITRDVGVNCIHGTAVYTELFHHDRIAQLSVEDLCAEFVNDVYSGIDETDVRAGVIGEIGLSGHIHDDEERVLRAAARAAAETGAPLSVHPPGRTPHSQRSRSYPSSRWGLNILDIIEEEGLPANRVALCHMDRTVYEDICYQRQLADRGAYIEYDLWGHELYLSQYNDAYMSDSQRLDFTTSLISDGYEEQLLFSQDVCNKVQYTAYGGYGYAHIPRNVQSMLRGRGVDGSTIEMICTQNPQSWLTFASPR